MSRDDGDRKVATLPMAGFRPVERELHAVPGLQIAGGQMRDMAKAQVLGGAVFGVLPAVDAPANAGRRLGKETQLLPRAQTMARMAEAPQQMTRLGAPSGVALPCLRRRVDRTAEREAQAQLVVFGVRPDERHRRTARPPGLQAVF